MLGFVRGVARQEGTEVLNACVGGGHVLEQLGGKCREGKKQTVVSLWERSRLRELEEILILFRVRS